jgi:TolB-like protein
MHISAAPAPAMLLCAVWLAAGCAPAPGGVTPDPRPAAEEAARRAIVNERELDAASLSPRSLGIPPFEVASRDTNVAALGYGLADLLTTDLARSGRLEVVDRIRLDAVLREIHLVESGRVDTATAPRVGKLVQARRLILGNLTEKSGGGFLVAANIADVATGELRTAVAAETSLEEILRAEKELAFLLFDQLGVTLTPAERGAVEQLPTKNIAALLAYSRGVRFEAEGRYAEARREYQAAVQLDPGFQAAQEHLESVEGGAGGPAPVQQANAGSTRAVERVVTGIGGSFGSPLGSLLIAPPGEGGSDLVLPTTVIITVEVPH